MCCSLRAGLCKVSNPAYERKKRKNKAWRAGYTLEWREPGDAEAAKKAGTAASEATE